jgi:hypothetical protein
VIRESHAQASLVSRTLEGETALLLQLFVPTNLEGGHVTLCNVTSLPAGTVAHLSLPQGALQCDDAQPLCP